jgi:hypothetical protein
MQGECQSGTDCRFLANHRQIVGDLERSIRQENHKMMNLKGFRYIGGYCLLSKACTELAKKRKVFLFWWPASGSEGQNVGTALSVAVESALKAPLFGLLLKWTKL